MIRIGTFATQSFTYALEACVKKAAQAISYANVDEAFTWHFTTDRDQSVRLAANLAERLISGCKAIVTEIRDAEECGKPYKEQRQNLIARGQQELFDQARADNADRFWSIESDVLVHAKSLRVMLDGLQFDHGYYDVSSCTYPSQGGGAFLGGHGDPVHPIAECFNDDERHVPRELAEDMSMIKKEFASLRAPASAELQERAEIVRDKIKQCAPKGNVFALNAKKWRRRGWLDNAYPGIGQGALLPSDWCGLGCTLLSSRALALADFYGYEGRGTQDLFLCWNKWWPAGCRINVIPHAPCDHIIRPPDGSGVDPIHCHAYHEPVGEAAGHLRSKKIPWKCL